MNGVYIIRGDIDEPHALLLEGRYGSSLVLRAHLVGAGLDGVERELAFALAAALAFATTAFVFLAAWCGRLGALSEHVVADRLGNILAGLLEPRSKCLQ